LSVFIDPPITIVVPAVTGFGGELATGPAGVDKTFIGLPVAIVISPVAGLVRGPGRISALQQESIVVALRGLLTALHRVAAAEPHSAFTNVSDVDGRAAGEGDLVRDPVAIIVYLVTVLGLRQDAVAADPVPCTAVGIPFATSADVHAAGPGDGVFGALDVVDEPIAVVVQAVAAFGLYGGTPPTGIHNVLVDASIAVVVSVITDLVRCFTASTAGIECALVYAPVAILVLTVTDFRRVGAALSTGITDALVDPVVAVVILSIAGFAGDGLRKNPAEGIP